MKQKDIIIYTAEGAIPGFLNLPDTTAPAPAIVFTNGYTAYHEMYDAMAKAFCEAGYVTLQYEQRGSAGSRHGFQLCGTEWKDDINAAVSFIYGCPQTDRQRIGLAGVSMGGAMTLIQGAVDPRVKALYAMAPFINGQISIHQRFLEKTGEPQFQDFLEHCFEDAARMAHGFEGTRVPEGYSVFTGETNLTVGEEEQEARRQHPLKITDLPWASIWNTYMYVDALAAARQIRVPTLLTHGTADETLAFENSALLFEALGCSEKKFIPIPGAGHVLPEVAEKESIQYGLDWFNQYLKC